MRVTVALVGQQIQTALTALDIYIQLHYGKIYAIELLYENKTNPEIRTKNAEKEKAFHETLVELRQALCPDLARSSYTTGRDIFSENVDWRGVEACNLHYEIVSEYLWFQYPDRMIPEDDLPVRGREYPPADCRVCMYDKKEIEIVDIEAEQYGVLAEAAEVYRDILFGDLRNAFSHYTNDEEILSLAERAEKDVPSNLRKSSVSNADRVYEYICDHNPCKYTNKICESKGILDKLVKTYTEGIKDMQERTLFEELQEGLAQAIEYAYGRENARITEISDSK